MYGSPKIHKPGYPLREIVDSTNGVTKSIDKHISTIIKTYVGHTDHHIDNSRQFLDKIRHEKMEQDETMVSYDIVALYPSVPQDEAIELVHSKMLNDENLGSKTAMTAEQITKLFRTCVTRTYFQFNQKLYQQVDGLAIGASTSGFCANIFMEHLERKALDTFTNPPTLWLRYVDDTFSKLKTAYIDEFLEHLNSQHAKIAFTTEKEEDNKIAFLDILVKREDDGSLNTSVYRKKTHTDQYLNFQSNHHLTQKLGIVSTLKQRIDTHVSTNTEKQTEEEHINQALRSCGHPDWSLTKKKSANPKKDQEKQEPYARVAIPYTKQLSERIARTYKKFNIQTIHKPTSTIKNIVCNRAKDKVHSLDRAGVVYSINCKKDNCQYIGETGRSLKTRCYEHHAVTHQSATRTHSLRADSPPAPAQTTRRSSRNVPRRDYRKMEKGMDNITAHTDEGNTGMSRHLYSTPHNDEDVEIKIVSTERNRYRRWIKEAIAIKKEKPALNDEEGRYILSNIYQRLYSPVLEQDYRRNDNNNNNKKVDNPNVPPAEPPIAKWRE